MLSNNQILEELWGSDGNGTEKCRVVKKETHQVPNQMHSWINQSGIHNILHLHLAETWNVSHRYANNYVHVRDATDGRLKCRGVVGGVYPLLFTERWPNICVLCWQNYLFLCFNNDDDDDDNQIKYNVMVGACGTYGRWERCIQEFCRETWGQETTLKT